jgi:uncharacterized phage protein gp47/JayE
MTPQDRRTRLLASKLNGIDFVEVVGLDTSGGAVRTTLRVHFLNAVPLVKPGDPPPPVSITGGERIRTLTVEPIRPADWSADDTHLLLNLSADGIGDFSVYTLSIISPLLDRLFASVPFSFKAGCPSDLDCQEAAAVCPRPPPDPSTPPIDYLAKDFLSFRQALLDFSALRYPEWQERSEADFGMVFLEALCSLADDLSYTQDRIAAEAALSTATQRRSLVRLARLVDYEPRPATAATVLLQFNVRPEQKTIPDGLLVSAAGPDGTAIAFETGSALSSRPIDPHTGIPGPPTGGTPVSAAWNNDRFNHLIRPYCWFDDSRRCLKAGATSMYVLGQGFNFTPGQLLLIETDPQSTADPPLRQIVRLLDDPTQATAKLCDPLFAPAKDLPPPPPGVVWICPDNPQGTAVTCIRWRPEDALTTDRDLSCTRVSGNLVVATQGLTQPSERFAIPPPPPQQPPLPAAIVRTGPNDSPDSPSLQYLRTLRMAPLAWLQPDDPGQPPVPEIVLSGPTPDGEVGPWLFRHWLLDAEALDAAFTIDPVRYTLLGGSSSAYEYDGDAGDTIRFGDGVFGAVPDQGVVFAVTYRVGGGAAGNVAPDTITGLDPRLPGVLSVSNPLPAAGGADAEPAERIRRLAPEAFRTVPLRAVLPSDYQDAAATLSWVQRAGTVFRWTGSWLTAFTTPDPRGSERVTVGQRVELTDLLNRRRLAGYESYVPDPRYLSVDLRVEVCAQPQAFRGDVEQAVTAALGHAAGAFFDPNNFTFGQPLRLSSLAAAVQGVAGVAGLLGITCRVRGRTTDFTAMGDQVNVAADEIIRCDNDPSLPENGTLKVIVQGGK